MCTVTWWRSETGFELFFNRDELRMRADALPPRVHRGGSDGGVAVQFLAPEDGDFGGTWIAVNEAGLAIGLLNGFRSPDAEERDYRSRGLLVRDLASSPSVSEVQRRVEAVDREIYRSFRLLAIAPEAPALVAEWDRRALEVDTDAEGRVPLISSSFEEGAVGESRRREYARAVADRPTPDRLIAFHRSHENGPSPFSVCMHRPEAATRSFTRVRVGADEVELTYHAGPPCRDAADTSVRLPRVEAVQP